MDRVQKAVVASLIATSALAWIASINQPNMMVAMTTYNPLSISLFTASWTAGMAAMMFPAITPMILMYNRLATNNREGNQSSVTIQEEEKGGKTTSRPSFPPLRVILCGLLSFSVGFDGYCASSWMVSSDEQYYNDNRKFALYTVPVWFSVDCSRRLPIYSIEENMHWIL
jgi:hypothetical protein